MFIRPFRFTHHFHHSVGCRMLLFYTFTNLAVNHETTIETLRKVSLNIFKDPCIEFSDSYIRRRRYRLSTQNFAV